MYNISMLSIRIVACLSLMLWVSGCQEEQATVEADMLNDGYVVEADVSYGEIGPGVTYTEERESCLDRNPMRNLYFGDTHVHTAYSFDAYVNDTRLTPEESYRFARGESVSISPLDENGQGTQAIQLDHALDFVALTDHAEFLAEVQACIDPESPAYDAPNCVRFRTGGDSGILYFGIELAADYPSRFSDVCGEEGIDCETEARGVWRWIQEAAEAAYDRTENCEFTSFVAYEWSGSTGTSNLHRNVIFRNDVVPEQPTSYFEESTPLGLWRALSQDCLEAENGCDVLAIPHNANWSDGNMFIVEYPDAESAEEEIEQAVLRADLEPLIEIFQHKGDGECLNGLSGVYGEPDEMCDFEKLSWAVFRDCGDGTGVGSMAGLGCESRYNYVRYILLEGMKEQERIGVNPYRLGIIASTDTHNGIPGAVSEKNYVGHTGSQEDTAEGRMDDEGIVPGGVVNNPGGLAAVWAVENSRDGIFEAMERRETYGTSGPRMAVRFFGGWQYPEEICDAADMIEVGYERGVPMGGVLPAAPNEDTAPVFIATALRDAGTELVPGNLLQGIQVVKGWIDLAGLPMYQVYDIAGDLESGASVDVETCETSGEGADSLCTVWQDPDFNPEVSAYYYLRVLENPSCRWNTLLCNSLAEEERPFNCDDEDIDRIIQERAWTSPIWYTPDGI
jgi:hypothetical protein